jgi:hypothetical protein
LQDGSGRVAEAVVPYAGFGDFAAAIVSGAECTPVAGKGMLVCGVARLLPVQIE